MNKGEKRRKKKEKTFYKNGEKKTWKKKLGKKKGVSGFEPGTFSLEDH